MALSVATLNGFPGNVPSGSQTDAATYTFTAGVYTPGSTTYVAGFMDGEMRAKLFAGGGTGGVGLPTLVSITQVSVVDSLQSGSPTVIGQYVVRVQPQPGSPDVLSWQTFRLDPNALLIIASTSAG
jgi:hypothetical protein